ncbi:MAG: hypothetical protein Q9Q13_11040 [Acidobacteriota bacterium]|nr:hypothetical protein [Acidobacteriota bacterium]
MIPRQVQGFGEGVGLVVVVGLAEQGGRVPGQGGGQARASDEVDLEPRDPLGGQRTPGRGDPQAAVAHQGQGRHQVRPGDLVHRFEHRGQGFFREKGHGDIS